MPKTRTRLAAGVAALAAAASVAFGAAPAASAAAYPTSTIGAEDVDFGATYMTGKVTWYNRSVNVSGPAHFVGCRTVYVTTYDRHADGTWHFLNDRSTSPRCDTNYFVDLGPTADVAGGADAVLVEMRDGSGAPLPYAWKYYYRWDAS